MLCGVYKLWEARCIYLMVMPKIINKSHGSHVLKITPAQLRKKRPQESTDVVPAKNPPKVKLENHFHNSRVLELEQVMHTLICEGFGVFIVA